MSNFVTLAIIVADCVARVKADACHSFFAAAVTRGGGAPVSGRPSMT
jgi:hypothetical protein